MSSHMKNLAALCLSAFLASCGTGLPSVVEPLRTAPDAPFRQSRPAPEGRFRLEVPVIEVSRLQNGLTIASVQRPGTGEVEIALVNRSGGDPWYSHKRGLSSLMNRTLLEGSHLPDGRIGRHLGVPEDKVDVDVDQFASYLLIQTLSDRWAAGIQSVAWTARFPTFTDVAVGNQGFHFRFEHEFEYGHVKKDLVAELYRQVVGDKHRFANIPPPPPEYSVSEVRSEYQRRYWPEDLLLVVVGDIESHEAVQQKASTLFGAWRRPEGPRLVATKRRQARAQELARAWNRKASVRFIHNPNADDASVFVLLKGLPIGAPGEAAYRLALADLRSFRSGGIVSELRERHQYAYTVMAVRSVHPAGAETMLGAPVQPDRAVEAAKQLLAGVAKLGQEGLSEARLRELRNGELSDLALSLETNAGIMYHIGSHFVDHGADRLDMALGASLMEVRQVTSAQVKSVVNQVLDPKVAAVLIAGPEEAQRGIETLFPQ